MSENKKPKREVIAQILKAKEGGKDYVKISKDITLEKDSFLRLESKKYQLESLTAAFEAEKINEEYFLEKKAQLDTMPDFVLTQLVRYNK